MPYINRDERSEINVAVDSLVDAILSGSGGGIPMGRMNYAITRLCHMLLIEKGPLSYTKLSTVRAVIQDVNDEFYRKVFAPYEDLKRGENGSVSVLDRWS